MQAPIILSCPVFLQTSWRFCPVFKFSLAHQVSLYKISQYEQPGSVFTVKVRSIERTVCLLMGAMRQHLTWAKRGNQAGKCSRGREPDPLSPQANLILSPTAVHRDSGTQWTGGPMLAVSPLCPWDTHLKTPKGISCKLKFLMWKGMFPDIKKKNKHNTTSSSITQKKRLQFETLKKY